MTQCKKIEKSKENSSIDIAKFIASFLVIAVHTNPFSSFSVLLNSYFVNMVSRIGVCFFFVISGYFFFRGLEFKEGKIAKTKKNLDKLKHYFFRVLILYTLWSLVYLLWSIPSWYQNGWLSLIAFIDFGISFLFVQSYYHLWFLLSLIYAIPIMYLILSFLNVKKFICLFGIIYLTGILLDTYSWMNLFSIGLIEKFAQVIPRFHTIIFKVIPLLSISLIVDKIKITKSKSLILLVVSLIIQTAEMFLVYTFTSNKSNYTYTFFMITTLIFAIVLITRTDIKIKHSYVIRKTSTVIYCLHPLVIGVISIFVNRDEMNSFVYYILISVVSFLVSTFIVLIYKKFKCFNWLKYFL